MKHKPYKTRQPSIQYSGYEFFAQCLDEMLFEYTMDTYKPLMHNASTLTIEAQRVLGELEKGVLHDDRHFTEIVAELDWMMSRDAVARNLLSLDHETFLSDVTAKSIKASKAKLSLLMSALSRDDYCGAVENALKKEIETGRQKKEILYLARSWLSSAIAAGYSRRIIRQQLQESMLEVDTANEAEKLEKFFSEFKFEEKTYAVCVCGSSLFRAISDFLRSIKISCSDTPPEGIDPTFWPENRDQACYLALDVKALDIFSARKLCNYRFERVANFFSVFHHKDQASWSPIFAITERLDLGESERPSKLIWKQVSAPVPPMTRVIDLFPTRAARDMMRASGELKLTGPAMENFSRVVTLHGAAIRAVDADVQLLTLWSALEAIVPTCADGSIADKVTESLMPFLLIRYIDDIFDDLLADIRRWDKKFFQRNLATASSAFSHPSRALAERLLSRDCDGEKQEIVNATKPYYLLTNRINLIVERYKSPDQVRRCIDFHGRKVSWHLRRIYRSRNLYVHSGKSAPGTDSLVECAHRYLDVYFRSVFDISRKTPKVLSPESAWLVAKERLAAWKKNCVGKDRFSSESIHLLFADDR